MSEGDRVRDDALRIMYFGYNGFLIHSGEHTVAVDPGTSLYLLGLGPVIPKSEWEDVTHIVVTHADPDHYWNADRMAQVSGAPIICGSELVERRDGKSFIVHPRKRKLEYTAEVPRAVPMSHGEQTAVDGIEVHALPSQHGNLTISLVFGLVTKTITRDPEKLFTKGETGFVFDVDGVRIANLGDTIFLPDWDRLEPDILMIPIGGKDAGNTMDEKKALEAVLRIRPRLVIPCHYDCGFLFSKKGNPADTAWFQKAVESQNIRCVVMQPGEILIDPLSGVPGTRNSRTPFV